MLLAWELQEDPTCGRLSRNPLGWSHHVPPVLWRTSVRTGSSWMETKENLTRKSCTRIRCEDAIGFESVSLFQLPQDYSINPNMFLLFLWKSPKYQHQKAIKSTTYQPITIIFWNFTSPKPLLPFWKPKIFQPLPSFTFHPIRLQTAQGNWSASKMQLREPQAVCILGAQYCSSSTAA